MGFWLGFTAGTILTILAGQLFAFGFGRYLLRRKPSQKRMRGTP